MPITLNGDTGITGVPAIGSASANTAIILGDSGTNYNTCRAWVNFNGTGTVAIRANFNVTSITDNGVGDYTVNFTTAMPDANYSAVSTNSGSGASGEYLSGIISMSTTTVRMIAFKSGTGQADPTFFCVSVFR
jgi:hypothetical protein